MALTPAEIIAARVNGLHVDDSSSAGSSESTETTATAPVSISDESAFPTLGGGAKKSSAPVIPLWGPSMKAPITSDSESENGGVTATHVLATPVLTTPILGANGKSRPAQVATKSAAPNKFQTIQEAFSLDHQDQLNVTKPEFIKILTSVKTETKTNIECTLSLQNKKRTFLITGSAPNVRLAKRLVIKKLTNPVQITFTVPAKIRSRIIGQQGKTLKPIIQANEVRIDIGNEEETEEETVTDEEDDIFSKSIKITIEGDAEGVKAAKSQILAIVKEETKNLSAKITVDDLIKPFIGFELTPILQKFPDLDILIPDHKTPGNRILIVGSREDTIEAKLQIKAVIAQLEDKITSVEVPIPKLKHQFLPIDSILDSQKVLIKLPTGDESSVTFIGEKKRIPAAQEEARKATSQYKVEVLDMSKAHKGDLQHVRAVAAYLEKQKFFKEVATANSVVINSPDLRVESTTIPIEIVSKLDEADQVKTAKKTIVNQVNKITPDQTKVINDIDTFLIAKVGATIKDVAKENKISYVILGNLITLFSNVETEESDDFDFVDTSSSTSGFAKVDSALDSLREIAKTLYSVVISVPSSEQSHISGPRKSTLNSILSNVEPNAVVVKLHQNDSGSSDDEVYIHGIKSEVLTVQKDIEAVLSDAQEHKDGYSTSVVVPTSILSRLIGKSGANLNSLREEFGVKIDVAEETLGEKAEISVAGSKRNAEEAKLRIQQLSKKWADETLVRLKIENIFHRRMIGPSGVYINRLQDKYNVKIRFPSADGSNLGSYTESPKSKDEVTIKGPSKGVVKAEEELKELLQYEKENGFKHLIQIPTKAIARVIGKAGETINDIADGCGIEYNFKRGEDEEKLGFAQVELTGSKSALKEATAKIEQIISEIENYVSLSVSVARKFHRDLIGAGGSVMKEIISKAGGDLLPRNRQYKLLTIPNEGVESDEITSEGDKTIVEKIIAQVKAIIALKEAAVQFEYDLPKSKHRLIVGPSGLIRKALQDEFDATIDIPRPNDESTIVKLSALPEKLEALKAKIEELTKDDWSVSIDIPEKYHALVSERGAIFNKLQSDFGVEVAHGNLTRKASKLSSATLPTPPQSAQPTDEDVKSLFTIVAQESTGEEGESIPWRLKGKDTEKAAKFVNERLAHAKEASFNGWLYAKNPSVFSKIIGPKGSKVNQIRQKSHTFITVPRGNDKNSNFVYLVGSEENLKVAQEEIEKVLN